MDKIRQIGSDAVKRDALDKVTGQALFGNDIKMEGMLYGKVLRSHVPHANVKSINTQKAREMPGVKAILTHEDIPGENGVGIIFKDEPVLVEDKIRRNQDALCLIAAESPEIAEAAARNVEVELEEITPVSDVKDAMDEKAPKVHGDSNVAITKNLIKNDVDKAFEECDVIVENNYTTQQVAHAFIEPQVTVAHYNEGIMKFWAASQNIHFDRGEVSRVLGLPQNKVRGIQAVTGAGFGGKLDIAGQCHASLLSYYTGRPVKIVHTFEETMHTSSKRHPYLMKYKTGATKDGKIVALDAEILLDTGAYASYGPGVLTRGIVHATGPYEVPNVRIKGHLVYTNNPMAGAMRGFGVPQVAVAHESQMDILAEKLNMNPFDIRLKNALRKGSKTATNQVLEHSVGIAETIEQARDKAEEIFGDEGRNN
ncbi:xanthine dehydrogenase family protein molybdopterin-binding subunit [Natranaerobius thermophilus]|uniref:Aldehyde oxidase and xanthine dehydrogenase a/b hammerhead n=1 Tax=Natranaerobius thermophilus (strain ATCC BAA-1301 / DSM 18059 / JW/NM-WN-LF) TaxID=457570 RepID=B2A7K8_NATTJ|nr:molybdopterin cofactor-binding domain-containing protein [Natranaerobius thermophilus]ACB85717.1 aldehyde oxidase and xanthine dehydrogenase a/b hammerhead [Natranaerobius thermophilus JW/NM-WN-LF]